MKVVLISCVSMKANKATEAENLYISPLFIKSIAYAKQLKPDRIFILSAKYGLIDHKKIIEPYNVTLKNFTEQERKNWADKVINDLKKECSLDTDEFIILAGSVYYKYLLPSIKNYKLPMGCLPIGKRLQWLTENTKSEYLLF